MQAGSSEADIRRAYLQKSRESHPDKRPEAEREKATALFQRVAAAYALLKDGGASSAEYSDDEFEKMAAFFAHMAR